MRKKELINFCKCGCKTLVEGNWKKGHCRRGVHFSEEHKNKISIANSLPREERICACGCGKKFVCRITRKQKFLWGHNTRLFTSEFMSKIHKGHVCSEKTKQKISLANSGENNGMYGYIPNKEERIAASERLKNNLKNPKFYTKFINQPNRSNDCRKGALVIAERKMFTRFYNTKPEREMKIILDNLNIEYVAGKGIFDIEHCYAADFYIPKLHAVVEVDGKHWHDYPNGLKIDKIRTKELKDTGYGVFRFWEGEFDENVVREKLLS
jgi:very-short-patch-repair endonuclease